MKKNTKDAERQTWIRKLDRIVSLYVRMRDSREYGFKYCRCISCGKVKPISDIDCGHYISRRCMLLRFDTRNLNGECSRCNRFDVDHLIDYRKNLIWRLGRQALERSKFSTVTDPAIREKFIKEYGEKNVAKLESERFKTKKWDVDELKSLYVHFSQMILDLRGEAH